MKSLILFLNFFGIRVFSELLKFYVCKESAGETLYFTNLRNSPVLFSNDITKAVVYSTAGDADDAKSVLPYDRLFIKSELKQK